MFFVDTIIMLAISLSLYNDQSFRSSNKSQVKTFDTGAGGLEGGFV
jgi:hypothetical protein